MKIFIHRGNLGNYHDGHVVVMAPDLDAAIEWFADHLANEWGSGDPSALRNLTEHLAKDGREYWWNWDPGDGTFVPLDEVWAVFREKMRALEWEIIDPATAEPQVLAYDNGDC